MKTVERILEVGATKEDIEELKSILNKGMQTLKKTTDASEITPLVPQIIIPEVVFFSEIKMKLTKIVTQTSLSDREKSIISAASGNLTELQSVSDLLNNEKINVCPTCLQKISDAYRSEMKIHIGNILNKEISGYRDNLEKYLLKSIDTSPYQRYQKINGQKYLKLSEIFENLNEFILQHNGLIQGKLRDTIQVVEYLIEDDLLKYYRDASAIIDEIEIERVAYNKTVSARDTVKKNLHNYNDQLAYLEISERFGDYVTQKKRHEKNREGLFEVDKQLKENGKKHTELLENLNKTNIAKDEINEALRYIFYSKNHLQLVSSGENDGIYHLKVNGENVLPSKISSGERNAIALSYFFYDIARGNSELAFYEKDIFLVIDDPITSFDLGNRIGISSFLRMKIEEVLRGNEDSKLLLMTHDFSVAFDMQKIFGEIDKVLSNVPGSQKVKTNYYELKKMNLLGLKT